MIACKQTPELETIADEIPEFVTRIDVPISTQWLGASDEALGCSELSVLFDALTVYEMHTKDNQDDPDRDMIIGAIQDIKGNLLNATLTHLSVSTNLLHKMSIRRFY